MYEALTLAYTTKHIYTHMRIVTYMYKHMYKHMYTLGHSTLLAQKAEHDETKNIADSSVFLLSSLFLAID